MKLVVICSIFSFVGIITGQFNNYEVYYEWKQVDYDFPNATVRNESLKSGAYIPINCAPTGVKIYKDMVFLATPRYRAGVPSTLNWIPYRKSLTDQFFHRNQGPKMRPFPNWEMQEIGNCSALQLVQGIELDPYNRLWIVDTGRPEALTEKPRNLCPAKLVVYDLPGKKIDFVYEFPPEVVSRTTNLIKDIQIACLDRDHCHAYISNLFEVHSIVVFHLHGDIRDSWYATRPTMKPDPNWDHITIDGVTAYIPFGQTGLGLTPKSTNYSTVYFSNKAGDHLYSVPTTILKNSATLKQNPALPDSAVTDLGAKPQGQADGGAMDHRGRWYFGSLPDSAVYWIDTTGNPTQLPRVQRSIQNDKDLQWPDMFSFDNRGYLLFTSTRFQLFTSMMVNPNEVNYRLIRFRTDSRAYNM